jgi:hypothetical protein
MLDDAKKQTDLVKGLLMHFKGKLEIGFEIHLRV